MKKTILKLLTIYVSINEKIYNLLGRSFFEKGYIDTFIMPLSVFFVTMSILTLPIDNVIINFLTIFFMISPIIIHGLLIEPISKGEEYILKTIYKGLKSKNAKEKFIIITFHKYIGKEDYEIILNGDKSKVYDYKIKKFEKYINFFKDLGVEITPKKIKHHSLKEKYNNIQKRKEELKLEEKEILKEIKKNDYKVNIEEIIAENKLEIEIENT